MAKAKNKASSDFAQIKQLMDSEEQVINDEDETRKRQKDYFEHPLIE